MGRLTRYAGRTELVASKRGRIPAVPQQPVNKEERCT
jgi:hypothetical protein